MAEGHVSHRNAGRLTAALAGKRIVHVDDAPQVESQRIPRRLLGDALVRAEARGKHHLLRFESGRVLHSHLGMNGSWRVRSAGDPPSDRGIWLAIWTDDTVATQHGGPRLRLYEPGEPVPALGRVGVDILDASIDPGQAMIDAITRADPLRPIGDTLLDQALVAGIGNIYRAEALFLAGIDPWRPSGSVTDDEARQLGTVAEEIMRSGIANPGPITTHHGPGGRTWVSRRRGAPCRRCGTPIRSRGMGDANRTIYWCPRCQA